MKEVTHKALSIIGVIFAGLLLAYTGYQTFSLLVEVSGSPLIAAIGLIMFEVGMLYWWMVFRNSAEGLLQMALSFLVFLACLTFVVLATALKLGAVDAAVLGVNTPAKIITAAAVIQLTAKLFFPIFHPETMREITARSQEGKILSTAQDKFERRIDRIADDVADGMAAEWTARLTTNFNTKYNTRYQLPDAPAPVVIEGQSVDRPSAPPRQSWRDRLRGRQPVAVQVVDSTQSVDSAPALATPGQGATPRLHPDDVAAIAAVVAQMSAPVPVPAAPSPNGQEGNGSAPRP